MEGVLVERDETEPFCEYFEFVLVDGYVFGPRGDIAASGTYKCTLVGHKRNVYYIPNNKKANEHTNNNHEKYTSLFILEGSLLT